MDVPRCGSGQSIIATPGRLAPHLETRETDFIFDWSGSSMVPFSFVPGMENVGPAAIAFNFFVDLMPRVRPKMPSEINLQILNYIDDDHTTSRRNFRDLYVIY